MRSLQVVMLSLCLLGGLYLLTQAPSFFMPERWDPSIGRQFGPHASRLLGGALLTMAAIGALYMRAMYYSEQRRLPDPAAQLRYFVLLMLALALFTAALWVAEPGANPDYRPPISARPRKRTRRPRRVPGQGPQSACVQASSCPSRRRA